jgi:hypothetical protein
MSDDIKDDTHDQLVKAFIEYSRWSERFERFGYLASSRQARIHLSKIKELVGTRRKEIQAKRNQIHGNPRSKAQNGTD